MMRLTLLLTLVFSINAWGTVLSQETRVSLRMNDVSLEKIILELREQTGVRFFYSIDKIKSIVDLSVDVSDALIEDVLNDLLKGTGLTFTLMDDVIVIKPVLSDGIPISQQQATITGKVTDKSGAPIPGVTVLLKGTHHGVSTNARGEFTLLLPEIKDPVILFSFIGMISKEVRYAGEESITVVMEDDIVEIEGVVVTGIFDRPDKSFTGSATTFTKQDLFEAGNQNLIKSLGNLDPSFMIMDNLEFGSDPNRMPDIVMRGQSSFPDLQGEYSGNPNQPLFILDGFETTIEKIYDLDMNRVESITLLKDAAAKSIYGSKAGNGVVVIQMVKPKTGELRIHYSGTLDIEAPDLTSYNLMNGREKLKFEKDHNLYKVENSPATQLALDRLYQIHYENIESGVDTYWLSKPLRVGVGQKHSVSFEGGDTKMRYSAGFNYNGVKGVMKGSDRSTFSVNTTLSYNHKGFLFRNTVEFSRNNSDNSPYGGFHEYALLNPYWIPYDGNGNPNLLLGEYQGTPYYNPLYNATLNTKNTSAYTEVRENFQMDWQIVSSLKFVARFNYSYRFGESDVFYPASHTRFINYDALGMSDRKGTYTRGENKSQSVQGNIGLTYSKSFDKHLIFGNATWNIASSKSLSHSFTAEGFGNDKMDDISFATKYPTNGRPYGFSDEQREIGLIAALNYSYDDRYLIDVSLRTSASSVFGDNARWGNFWSFGLGWNVHQEAFAQGVQWLDRFKVRGSLGYTGTQNFDPFQAKARYEYTDIVYDNRYGAQLMGLPNPNLQWQRVLDYNIGADLSLLGVVNLKFDYFVSVTDDLLIDNTAPPSLGFSTYKENLGKVNNRGFDTTISTTVWRDRGKRGWLTLLVSGMHNRNTIKKISNALEHRNDLLNSQKGQSSAEVTRPSTLYYEGQSMTAIWGVRSVGIDPATGNELFYDLDGNHTFNWHTANQVVIGDTSPKLSGSIGINAGYKGFTLSISGRYKFGGEMYNKTLVDKIENVDGRTNIDRRVSQTWLNPGDIARYKKNGITPYTYYPDYTKPTSRFVMKDNELYISTLNMGYDFRDLNAIEKLGLRSLKVTFYMNDLVRLSSVDIERGTSYPFSRNFSLSLQATF